MTRKVSETKDRSVFHAPAVKALVVQVCCLLIVWLMAGLVDTFSGVQVTIVAAAFLQGVFAAAISRILRLASWWSFIQFFFPISLLGVHSLHLSPNIFLGAFILFLGLYWSTFRTQVPFYPSTPSAAKAVAGLLPKNRSIFFIDIGSGLGGLVMNLAAQRPESNFVGIEVAPLAWLVGWMRAKLSGSRGRFVYGDYCKLDFSQYDVVFAYLSPAAMPALWQKASQEMRRGTLLLSYEFCIPGVKPQLALSTESDDTILYGWYF